MGISAQQLARPASGRERGQIVWLILVQIAVLALAGLSLAWAPVPAKAHQALLLLLAAALLAAAVAPAWRRAPMTGILAGVALATACWFSHDETWMITEPESLMLIAYYVPKIALIVVCAALLLAVWGLTVRADCRDASRFGVAALAGGALIAGIGMAFYLVLNHTPLLTNPAGARLYGVEPYQLAALLAAVMTYPPALWLGGVAVRPGRHLMMLPAGLAVLLGAFLVYWRLVPQGGG